MNEPHQHEEEHFDPDLPDGEVEVAASLKAALHQLRTDADRVAQLEGEQAVDAAEQVVEQAAALDEQLGSVARDNGSG